MPKIDAATAAELTAAATVAIKTSGEKLFVISSKQKITPASGALNAAAKPAPEPAVKRNLSSVRGRDHNRLHHCPTQEPNCTLGPSRPRDMPAPMPSTPPMNFSDSTLCAFMRMRPSKIPFTCGMPLPEISGSAARNRANSQATATRKSPHPKNPTGNRALIHAKKIGR